jgi:hypothetical protein
MTKGEDLELQRGTAPKRSEECGEKGGQQVPARKTTKKGQLPVYQSDPILRELQAPVHGVRDNLRGLAQPLLQDSYVAHAPCPVFSLVRY